MCAFVDRKTVMDRLSKNSGKFVRSILGLDNFRGNSLIMAYIGELTPEFFLTKQLIIQRQKTEQRFGFKTTLWNDTLQAFYLRINKCLVNITQEELENKIIIDNNYINNLCTYTILKEHKINSEFRLFECINKYWWKYCWKGSKLIIKFLCRMGWFSEDWHRNCNKCNNYITNRNHFLNECTFFTPAAEGILKLLSIYFPKEKWERKTLTEDLDKLFYSQKGVFTTKLTLKVFQAIPMMICKCGTSKDKKEEENEYNERHNINPKDYENIHYEDNYISTPSKSDNKNNLNQNGRKLNKVY